MERFLSQGNYLEQDAFPVICEAFKSLDIYIRFITMELNMADEGSAIAPPKPQTTSETVEAAFKDTELLISQRGGSFRARS